jgi:hypothetical protein
MNLMHALTGGLLGGGNLTGQTGIANMSNAAQQQAAYGTVLGSAQTPVKASSSQTVFNGRINVEKVANGYVINIATREGYSYDTYIATTIQEVNERIAASMVSFQLENK